jgi:prophage regulatory protein
MRVNSRCTNSASSLNSPENVFADREDRPRSNPDLISIKETARRTSSSRASIYRLIPERSFPRTLPRHGVRRAFVDAEVDEWIASRIAACGAEVA